MTESGSPVPPRRAAIGRSAVTGVGGLLIARIVLGVSTLALFALLAQTLPSEEFGLFGVAWSVSYLFAAVVEGGYGLLVVKEVAHAPGSTGYYLGAFLPVRLAVAVVLFGGALALAAAIGWESVPVVLAMAATAANLQVVSGVPRDFLIGHDRAELAAVHSIAETILRTLVILTAASVTGSVTTIFAAAAVFQLLWIAVGLPLVWVTLHPTGVVAGMRSWRSVLRASMPYGALVVLAALYTQVDILVVSALLPLETVALFLVASRVLVATDYVPEAAWRWAYPHLSRSIDDLPRRTSRLAEGLLALGLVTGAIVALSAPIFIPLIFGPNYEGSVVLMQVMAGAIPLRYLAHVYGTALSAGGRQSWRTGLFAAVISVSVVIEAILVVAGGVMGAALATVLSSGLLLGACLMAARVAWGARVDGRPVIVASLAATVLVVLVVGSSARW